jgi:hypothetical protein
MLTTPHVSAENGLGEADRQGEMNVISFSREKAVWLDVDLDQCVP